MPAPPPKRRRPLTEEHAREAALRALARREHSAAELKQKLARRGHDQLTAEEVVSSLSERGWQSDGRYAEMLLRSRLRQGCGPLRIEHELSAAGLPEADIRAALSAAAVDWGSICAQVQARRFGNPPQSAADWQKQYRFLAGRGFTAEQIRAVLRGEPDNHAD